MGKLMDFVLSYVFKMKFLDGYRSYLAGGGMVLSGLALVANQVAGGTYDHDTMEKGIGLVVAGTALIGHAGKQDKLIEAMKNK